MLKHAYNVGRRPTERSYWVFAETYGSKDRTEEHRLLTRIQPFDESNCVIVTITLTSK